MKNLLEGMNPVRIILVGFSLLFWVFRACNVTVLVHCHYPEHLLTTSHLTFNGLKARQSSQEFKETKTELNKCDLAGERKNYIINGIHYGLPQ